MVLELRKLSEDEKIRLRAEARADYDSRMATARGAGYREGRKQMLIDLVRQNILSSDDAADQLGVTKKEFIKMLNAQY